MAFDISVGGFFSFLGRPFTNPIGIIMLLGVAVYVWARLSGRIGGFGGRRERGGGSGRVDYVIK